MGQQNDQGFLINKGVLKVHIMIFVINTLDSTRLSSFHVSKKKFFFHNTPGGPQAQKWSRSIFGE